MVQTKRRFIKLIALVLVSLYNAQGKPLCPIGFKLAYTKHKGGSPICYRQKGPEAFTDRFVNCAGNLFTSQLYYDLDMMKTDFVLWSEYKSAYPGGPFVDSSYTNTMGRLLSTSADVINDDSVGIFQESCVVIDPISNFTSVSCDGNHYRYCFVEPYADDDKITTEGCESIEGFLRFSSPTTTCLTSLNATGGGTLRATWQQAKDLCEKRGSSLLNTGWRYSNHPILTKNYTSFSPYIPFAMYSNPEHTVIKYAMKNGNVEIPKSEWNFRKNYLKSWTAFTLGVVQDDYWYLMNSTDKFYNVICEVNIQLDCVTLDLTIDSENKIILSPSATVNKKQIICFTDSVMYYPVPVDTVYDEVSTIFIVKPKNNGYYWCVHIDSKNYNVTESNKVLFIREKTSLINVYAVKMKMKNKYKFDDLDKFYKNWEKKLKEYIFYRTKYAKYISDIDTADHAKTESLLKDLKGMHPRSDFKDKEIILSVKIKRLYLDSRTALVHVELNPEMNAVPPGTWDNLEIISMKPAYYCKGVDSVSTLSLEESTTTPGCRIYKCTGDFNEGVQWLITSSEICLSSTTIAVSDPARSHGEVSAIIPTVGTMMPNITTTQDILIREHDDSSEESTEQYISTATPDELNTTVPDTIIIPDTVATVDTLPENITTFAPRPPRPSSTTPLPDPTTTVASVPTTRPPPQEQLNQVMDDLQNLINDTAPIFVEYIDEAFDQVNELLSVTEDLEIPGRLLHLLDDIGSRLNLTNPENEAMVVRGNIALLAADAMPDTPVRGLRIKNKEDEELFIENAFQLIRDNSSYLNSSDTDLLVQLPQSVAVSSRRISFVVFRTDRAFQSNVKNVAVNSRILSVNVENFTEFENGEVIDIHFTPLETELGSNQTRVCAFWKFLDNETGHWSDEGCRFIPAATSGILDTCRCDHLTHFAEIVMPRTSLSDAHESALELISVIGCCMSIIGLLMIGLTAILFRSWRRDFSNKIWLQLCAAIFLLVVCFLISVYAGFEGNSVVCVFHGIIMHYSVLASFCWMLVAAVLSYRRLVTVFTRDISHKLLKASAFSWGAPCAVVGILLSINPQAYVGQFEGTPTKGGFCYPSGLGLWLSLYAPIALMLLVNWTLFILIVRSVFASRRITRHGDSNEAIRCVSVSCLLVFLFGLPWIFVLFLDNIVTVYLFCLTASYQGFVLFIFFVLGNKKTRDLWLNKLKIKQTRKIPVTSSTYTNRSTGNVGWRGGNTPAGANSIEAKVTKPKSLASSDNSRFS